MEDTNRPVIMKTIFFPKHLEAEVLEAANRRGENFSVCVRQWVREGLEREKREKVPA